MGDNIGATTCFYMFLCKSEDGEWLLIKTFSLMLWKSIQPSFSKVMCYSSVITSFIADGLWFGGWSLKGWHNSKESKEWRAGIKHCLPSQHLQLKILLKTYSVLIPREYFRFHEDFLKLRTFKNFAVLQVDKAWFYYNWPLIDLVD